MHVKVFFSRWTLSQSRRNWGIFKNQTVSWANCKLSNIPAHHTTHMLVNILTFCLSRQCTSVPIHLLPLPFNSPETLPCLQTLENLQNEIIPIIHKSLAYTTLTIYNMHNGIKSAKKEKRPFNYWLWHETLAWH